VADPDPPPVAEYVLVHLELDLDAPVLRRRFQLPVTPTEHVQRRMTSPCPASDVVAGTRSSSATTSAVANRFMATSWIDDLHERKRPSKGGLKHSVPR
jgi:hypothetical protein